MSAERNVINNHRLRGSASTVLTANCLEIGKCKIRPLAESKPLSRSTEKLSWVIRSARRPAVPNLVQTSVVFRDWGQSCPGVPSPSLSSPFPFPSFLSVISLTFLLFFFPPLLFPSFLPQNPVKVSGERCACCGTFHASLSLSQILTNFNNFCTAVTENEY